MINGFMGQLQGPFKANEDLYKKIKDNARTDFEFVSHLGIQVEYMRWEILKLQLFILKKIPMNIL